LKALEYRLELAEGLLPSVSTFLATYFTLTGLHAVHVAAGAIANLWIWRGLSRDDGLLVPGRLSAVALYWTFVDLVWMAILILCYLT
jgi:heme/copper-type cytochrome/quinol oxidase subunit 3